MAISFAQVDGQEPAYPRHSTINDDCQCRPCLLNRTVIEYMMWLMEPTDRALWPYPAPRLGMTEPPPPGYDR